MRLDKFVHKKWTETRYKNGELTKTQNFITYKFRYSHLKRVFNLKNKVNYFYEAKGKITLYTVKNEEFNISNALLENFGFQGRCWVVKSEKRWEIFRTTFYLTFILDESICFNSKCDLHNQNRCFHYLDYCKDRINEKEKIKE